MSDIKYFASFCLGQRTILTRVLTNVPPSIPVLCTAGLIPLETRFLHNPSSLHGYVGAALSSNIIHFTKVSGLQLHLRYWAGGLQAGAFSSGLLLGCTTQPSRQQHRRWRISPGTGCT